MLHDGRVLIVDDDADIREALTDTLQDEGLQVAATENGQAALDYLRSNARPAVILLDWMMPVMDGAQFYAELSRDPELCAVPVVLLTADANARERAATLGIAGYLKKPVNVEDLLSAIQRHATGDASL
jgi:CheY-like chemotaxis protein